MIDLKLNIGEYTLNIKGELDISVTKKNEEVPTHLPIKVPEEHLSF